jgi:2-keto-4-pentenoate hydratase/2-oxohepta-3-ene-1,7-dioic acid hydratase in catechol pathway
MTGPNAHMVASVRLGAEHQAQPAVLCGSRVHLFEPAAVSSLAQLVALCHEAGSVAAVTKRLSRRVVSLDDTVTLCAPLPGDATIFGIGKNYSEHVKEVDSTLPGISSASAPTAPIVFCKASTSLCGPRDAIVLPPHSQQVDYEGELGVVIGRAGRGIPAAAWRDHVFGFTVLNDVRCAPHEALLGALTQELTCHASLQRP